MGACEDSAERFRGALPGNGTAAPLEAPVTSGQAQGIWVKRFDSQDKHCPMQSCWQSGLGVFCLFCYFD